MKNICNNPEMVSHGTAGICANDKTICCWYCDKVKDCLSGYLEDDGFLCEHIHSENDLKTICPYVKQINK